jgi:photosystem II stability/assembly factor-like uncharacterized protein
MSTARQSWCSSPKLPVWGFIFVALLALSALPASAQAPEVDSDAGVEADMPPFADGVVDKESYMRARGEYLELMRGVPHFLPYDPRARALTEMEAMEARAALEIARRPEDTAFWTQLGPNPIPNGQTSPTSPVSGRVSAIAVDPTDEDIVYVGAAQGGVYRSTNGGTSWTQIFDSAQTLAIGALALAPSNPSILYVGTGESAGSADSFFGLGLYRVDNAQTTANLSGPFNPPVTTGVAGTTAFTGRAISEILVHPTDPATIFVSTTPGTGGNPSGGSIGFTVPPLAMLGVYRSTDATSVSPSFTKLTVATGVTVPPDTSGNISITDIAMDPTDPNRLVAWANGIAAANNGGAYLSTNALAPTPVFTHTQISTTASVRGEIAGNRVASTVTFYLATGESNGRLRKSTDGGATWSAFLTGGLNFCNPQCFYDIAVDVHPTDANIVNLGGSPTLVASRSTDGGASFTSNATSAAGVHVDTHVFVIADANPSVVYLGTDGGIYRSGDGGLTWTSLNNGDFHATQFQSLALHPSDRQFLIGGTQDNGTQFLKPDGSWTRADFGDGGYALIDQNAADTTNVTMYHTYFNQTNAMGFARVTNTGSAVDNGWQGFGCGFSGFVLNGISCSASAILFYAPIALGPGTPNTIYFGSDQLWRSANSGATMPAVSQVLVSGQPITAIGIAPTNDNVRIAGTRNGRVFATTTGANPLVDVTNASMPTPHPSDTNLRRPVSRAVIAHDNPNVAYVAFGGYNVPAGQHIWKTTNLAGGAAFWSPAGNGIPDVPVNSLVIHPTTSAVVFAATDIGVFKTVDGGANWVPFSEALPRVAVFDIGYFDGDDKVLRIATHGRGIWERDFDTTLFSDGFNSGNTGAWSLAFP